MERVSGKGSKEPRRRPSAPTREARPWPVTVLGIVLLSQSVLAAAVGAARLGVFDPAWLDPLVGSVNVYAGAGLLALAPLALVAAGGFFRPWRPAWTIGMGIQGLGLLVAILLYFYSGVAAGYVYAAMAYHVFTVLYLNSNGVRTVFRVGVREREHEA